MQLRKKYTMRLGGEDTLAVVARDGRGNVWVETGAGETITDARILDNGRTVSIRRDGRMYLVDIPPRGEGIFSALVNGRGGPVEILDELAAAAAEQEGAHEAPSELKAQMPGLVVSVKVEVGQAVKAGEAVLVLEAMKMQNELDAPADGVVEEILVAEGQSVETGAVLLRLGAGGEDDE